MGGPGGWCAPDAPALARERFRLDIRTVAYPELGELIGAARADAAAVERARRRAGEYLGLPNTKLETRREYVDNAFLLEEIFRRLMQKAGCGQMTIKAATKLSISAPTVEINASLALNATAGGATKINEAMKLASVREIAALAKAEVSIEVASAYAGRELKFGPEYLIPTPFDVRLILQLAPAVAQAAAESGVATRPIADLDAYRQSLTRFVYQTGMFMRPVFAAARAHPARVVYAEGEDERVLRAVQTVLDEHLAQPILVGRPEVVRMRIERAGLRLAPGRDFELVDPQQDPRFRAYWETYHELMGRGGVNPEAAKAAVRRSNTLISSLMLRRGEADAMLCGLLGRFDHHLEHVRNVIGRRADSRTLATMNALMLDRYTLFLADTFVNEEPSAEELVDIARMAVAEVQRFGLPPKVAFLSHSIFGSSQRAAARRMRAARDLFVQSMPDIECDGEMHGDAALSETIRRGYLPETTLTGAANLLMLPNLDAANILFNVLKTTGGSGVTVGPILLGAARPVHILTPNSTVRRIINMTAVAVAGVFDGAAERAA